MKHQPQKHSPLFRVTSTVVFALLLLNTVAMNYPESDDPLSRFLTFVQDILFGTSTSTMSATTTVSSDSTMVNGVDPSSIPPPPPPPK